MKQQTFTTTILEAEEGMYLTQASEDIDIKERIVGTTVAVGRNDSPDNWKEISAEQAEEYNSLRETEQVEELNSLEEADNSND